MRQKQQKIVTNVTFYIYLLNYLLILSIIVLRVLDIYYTFLLIDDAQITEVNPISRWMLTFDPAVVYIISTVPIALLCIVNYYLRDKPIYLLVLTTCAGLFIIYLIPPVQNSINIMGQL